MAWLTQWTWVWVDSWSWWWTRRPGMLQFMGSQRVGHGWATELNWNRQMQAWHCTDTVVDAQWELFPSIWCQKSWHLVHPYQSHIETEIWRKEKWMWKSLSCVQLFGTPWTIYSPRNSPGQNAGVCNLSLLQWLFPNGVGSLSLLQGIFPTHGLNPGLLHCGQTLYQLSHKESPRILAGVGSLFLLQQMFPTQEWNWCLLYCRWILYQLSYKGSPGGKRWLYSFARQRWKTQQSNILRTVTLAPPNPGKLQEVI